MESWIDYTGEQVSIDIKALLLLLWKKIVVILLTAIVMAGVFFAYSRFFITPLYESSIKMYVNNRAGNSENTDTISSADITASQNLVDTYTVVLKSKPTINAVIEETGVNYTYKELVSMISATSIDNTEIFMVTVTTDNAETSADIANAIAEIAPEKIMDVISGSSVKIVETAEPAAESSYPSTKKNTAMGGMLGFILACGVILLRSALGNGLSVEDRIQNDFSETSVLATIPEMQNGKKKKSKAALICDEMTFDVAEAYKLLRTNITFSFADKKNSHVIGITSSIQGEGKSTTAVNFAYTLAQTGKNVCIIDCDLRIPTIGKVLRIKNSPGLVNLLTGQQDGLVVHEVKKSGVSFSVVTSGDIPPNPSEILGSDQMRILLESLKKKFDYIILDLPPIQVVSDALTVKESLDGMILVVHEEFYKRNMLRESTAMLEKVNARLLGIVLTHSDTQKKSYSYGNGSYAYGYAAANNKAKNKKGKKSE